MPSLGLVQDATSHRCFCGATVTRVEVRTFSKINGVILKGCYSREDFHECKARGQWWPR